MSVFTKNIFQGLPLNSEEEVFDVLFESGEVKIERIISKGHKSPESGWYDQDKSEWVMVLQGAAVLSFESQPSVTLGEGDYINLPAHLKHKVDWTDPDVETVWLAIFY